MTSYQINARSTGHCLGIYEGCTPADAVEAMHRDAGYAGSGEAAAALETTVEALRAQLNVREVRVATDDDVQHTEDNVSRALLAAATEAGYMACDWSALAVRDELESRGFVADADSIDRVRDTYIAQLVADAASEADVEAMIADDVEVAS